MSIAYIVAEPGSSLCGSHLIQLWRQVVRFLARCFILILSFSLPALLLAQSTQSTILGTVLEF
jgi:hypothetical protein